MTTSRTSNRPIAIGDLARETDTNIQTIRYYEKIGLLRAPARSAGNQRLYADGDVVRLTFIRRSRALGFSLDMIREILVLTDRPEKSCEAVDNIARRHLETVREKLATLRRLERELKRMVADCEHGIIADCRVVEALSG